MTAPAIAPAALKTRLEDFTDYAIQGAWPPDDCGACALLGGWCERCAGLDADRNLLNGIILPAVQGAGSAREALTVFMAGLMDLTGASAGEFTAACIAAHMMRRHGADADCLEREAALIAAGNGGN